MLPARFRALRFNLSTRLTVAMIALVILTAAAVGLISVRNIDDVVLPRVLNELSLRTRLAASSLEASVQSARGDVLGFRAAVAIHGIMRATLNGGVDPDDGTSVESWVHRFEKRLMAELAAKPFYVQFRVVGVADGGREIVRVDRSGPGGAIRAVPQNELQRKGDRPYFRQAVRLADGEVYVSPIELNQESGKIETPFGPVLRAATPIHAPDGKPFCVVVINVDLQPAFARIRSMRNPSESAYVVNENGDYLVHPDPSREFGFELGTPFRIQDDIPALAGLLNAESFEPRVVEDRAGGRLGIAAASVRLVGGPRVSVIDTVSYAEIVKSSGAARNASLYVGLAAAFCAILLAILLSRSLTRPLVRMTRAVESFARGSRLDVPAHAGGEIGVLARAFERMSNEVTERTAETRRHAEIFDIIMTSMVDPVVLVDGKAALVYANPAAEAMHGPGLEAGSDNWEDAFEHIQADGVTPLRPENWPINRALRGENVDDAELIWQLPGQNTIRLVVSGRPIRDGSGALAGAVLIYRDVTEAKELERQLARSQRMDAVGQLTGGIAHDFNNILTVITGTGEALAEGVADRPRLAAMAKTIGMAAARGANLTRQLLAFARRQPLEPERTDVNALLSETIKLLGHTLGEHVDIKMVLDKDAWHAIVDPSQLSTALLNLAVNARDAMPGGGKLSFETRNINLDEPYARAHAEVRPGPYVMIAVSDTGEGIPAAIGEKVFEPFFTTKDVGKGTGLGLSMVYGFVKQSGGHIKIYSEEGHGTTIKLYLPRAPEQGDTVAEGAEHALFQAGAETILVVEDDEMVRNSVIAQLASLGYATLSARNAEEALALVDKGAAFDLLFTDMIMPGAMNGRQLAEELAKRQPSLRVLYTSGYTEDAVIHHGRLDAGVALLNKPYGKEALARKLRQVLDAPTRDV